ASELAPKLGNRPPAEACEECGHSDRSARQSRLFHASPTIDFLACYYVGNSFLKLNLTITPFFDGNTFAPFFRGSHHCLWSKQIRTISIGNTPNSQNWDSKVMPVSSREKVSESPFLFALLCRDAACLLISLPKQSA